MRKVLRYLIRITLICLLLFFYVNYNGIQYTLGLLTNSIRDPYFDSSGYEPARNCFGEEECSSGELRVLCYNILCRICEPEQPWEERLPYLRRLIAYYDPDLFGSQELGGWKDIEELLADTEEYETVTFTFGPWTYADSALFFKKERFELLDSGQFWLNPKHNLPFGFGWLRLSMPRYACWACLRDKSNGFTFLFMNSHFDNNSLNKDTTAPIMYDNFAKHGERLPIVFTGDFNTDLRAERYEKLLSGTEGVKVFTNAADLAPALEMQLYTAGERNTERESFTAYDQAIEHILVAGPGEVSVGEWIMDYNSYGDPQQDASDHPALFATLRFDLRKTETHDDED
ncbi:MAG: hypothetical protein GX130_04505 [Candidatus Hydrogenedens sp.]|jgi:endonuclease/exonuclease/phosphatase family metal-dependent hydrolase|nr:hypothetical protein [Candidatus Hydrogenedens sp.]